MPQSRADKMENRVLVAPCGLNCAICPLYLASHNSVKSKTERARIGIIGNNTCDGCRVEGGLNNAVCEIYDCCVNRNRLEFCYQCTDYPCRYLAPASESVSSIKKWLSYHAQASPP